MIYKKKVSVGVFLKKGVDIKDGDILEIANEGKEVEGQYGPQNVFLVKMADGKEGNIGFNPTSINNIIDAYGENATNWVGKKIKAWTFNDFKDGKPQIKLIVSHPDAQLTKDGFVLIGKTKDEPNDKAQMAGEISIDDVGF